MHKTKDIEHHLLGRECANTVAFVFMSDNVASGRSCYDSTIGHDIIHLFLLLPFFARLTRLLIYDESW